MTAPSSIDFLGVNSSRGPKIIAWDNLPVGTRVEGIIVREPTVTQQTDPQTRQPRFFPVDPETGTRDPIYQMLVVIDTGNPDPAQEGDDGLRTLAIRGGFKYESSKKALTDALKNHGLTNVRIGDHIAMTRLPNRTGAGISGRTHQFAVEYTLADDLSDTQKAPAKKASRARKPAATPAPAAVADVSDAWDEE